MEDVAKFAGVRPVDVVRQVRHVIVLVADHTIGLTAVTDAFVRPPKLFVEVVTNLLSLLNCEIEVVAKLAVVKLVDVVI